MRRLAFAAAETATDGRRVRVARFAERSLLPLAAACLVANGVRETLAALFAATLETRLYAPLIPTREGWRCVYEGARWFRVRGSSGDAAIVLGADAMLALAAGAFGERASRGRAPSAIEREVLARIVASLAGTLTALTGTPEGAPREGEPDPATYQTFFEIAVAGAIEARVGIATREPSPAQAGPTVRVADIGGAHLELTACLPARAFAPVRLGDLRVGACLPITSLAAELRAGGSPFAAGLTGVRNGRYAVRFDEPALATRGTI